MIDHINLLSSVQQEHYHTYLNTLLEAGFLQSLKQQDPNLWGESAAQEACRRLGWLKPNYMQKDLATAKSHHRRFLDLNIKNIVYCAMGGSGLSACVIANEFSQLPIGLKPLTTSHPRKILNCIEGYLPNSAFIFASKSGTTAEILYAKQLIIQAFKTQKIDIANRCVVITDPETPLHMWAKERNIPLFLANEDIGGRFSAISPFGLIPATLCGADCAHIISEYFNALEYLLEKSHIALSIAAFLLACLKEPYLPVFGSSKLSAWLTQLLAESLGKDKKGFLPFCATKFYSKQHSVDTPIPLDAPISVELEIAPTYSKPTAKNIKNIDLPNTNRLHIRASLGMHFALWHIAVTALGKLLSVNPFDQPNVELAKVKAQETLRSPTSTPVQQDELKDFFNILTSTEKNEWIAFHLYLDVQPEFRDMLKTLCARYTDANIIIEDAPSFLHSTGQFYKGGNFTGKCIQICDVQNNTSNPNAQPCLLIAQMNGDRCAMQELGIQVCSLYFDSTADMNAQLFGSLDAGR